MESFRRAVPSAWLIGFLVPSGLVPALDAAVPDGEASKVVITPNRATPRFRVAANAVQSAARKIGDSGPAYLAELERGFRRLRNEFPEEPEVYSELLYIADHQSETTNALQLVREILDWPAPDGVKEKARGVQRKRETIGRVWPLDFTSTDQRRLTTDSLRGKVVLLDFWATWCQPCRDGLPGLKMSYETWKDRGFEIVGFSFDTKEEVLASFIRREKISWPQHFGGEGFDGAIARQFGITSLPTMLLLDRQGRLRELDARDGLTNKVERLLLEQ